MIISFIAGDVACVSLDRVRRTCPFQKPSPDTFIKEYNHHRTHVILLIHDLHVRIINAVTGELLRDLVIDPSRDYQARHKTT